MYVHPRSVVDKIFDVWRSPGRFTKNPDMVRLPSGRLLLVYSDNDAHWSQETQILTILASDDDGRNWFKLSEVDSADLRPCRDMLTMCAAKCKTRLPPATISPSVLATPCSRQWHTTARLRRFSKPWRQLLAPQPFGQCLATKTRSSASIRKAI